MRLRGIDLRVDIAGLKFFSIDRRYIQRPRHKTGQSDSGTLRREDLSDSLPLKAVRQFVPHLLH